MRGEKKREMERKRGKHRADNMAARREYEDGNTELVDQRVSLGCDYK